MPFRVLFRVRHGGLNSVCVRVCVRVRVRVRVVRAEQEACRRYESGS